MKNITLSELKKAQQITSLDECINMDFDNKENYNKFKDIFPKSVEAIEKLPTDKTYVNTEDVQGCEFAFYSYGSLKAWAYWALNNLSSIDEYNEEAEPDDEHITNIYRLFEGFIDEEVIIDTLNECWQIEIAKLEVQQ